jgi:predicted dehydrogenase
MESFRVVLLGTSFARTVQAVAFARHPGFRLVGLAGGTRERTERAARELGIPRAATDWRELVDEEGPDLVSVVTPVDLHHPMTMAALEGGAHVLCEKPTALHRFQAADMRDRARSLGRVAAINHEFRFFPARRHGLALVRAGAIGTPRRGEILGRYPIWHRPDSRGMTWLSQRERGGGILGALGSHHTDCLRLFLGEPRSVQAEVRVLQPRRGPTADRPEAGLATADDACTLSYEFANGATGLVDLNATTPYRWERFEIQGSEGALRWDETGYRLWRIVAGREPEEVAIPEALQLAPRAGEPALVAPFAVMLERLHAALAGEAPMEPDFDDAVAVQSALDAARASSDSGTRVAVEIPAHLAAAQRSGVAPA